jgi:hypothetical protein
MDKIHDSPGNRNESGNRDESRSRGDSRPPSVPAVLVGRVVAAGEDGPWLASELEGALVRTNEMVPAAVALQSTGEGGFRGAYESGGPALNAVLLVRLFLHGLAEVPAVVALRLVSPSSSGLEEGGAGSGEEDPASKGNALAWEAAAGTLPRAAGLEAARGTPLGWRTAVVELGASRGHPRAPTPPLASVAMLRDFVLSRMDERDAHLVLALLEGSTVTAAARAAGISQQAASRRLQANGGYALLRSWRQLAREANPTT